MTWLKSSYFGGSTQPVGPLVEPTEVQNRKGAESGLGSAVHLAMFNHNKTISDGGITVDFWFIKVHASNW